MKRLLHLSDLHFGRSSPDLVDPLLSAIGEIAPDLVVISGDFTQRARHSQFAEARAFLDRIDRPVLAVPGNHDTPLDNLWVRFLRPFSRYRKAIDRNLEPAWEDPEISVLGVNTVNPFAWQSGKIGRHTTRRLCRHFDQSGEDRVQVAVLHHPLEHGPEVDKRLMKGATQALRDLADCGTDIVLSGHLHTTSAAPFTTAPGLLFVQAGTGLSTRLRGERNTFNVLDCTPGAVDITVWNADRTEGAPPRFRPAETAHFERTAEGWSRRDAPRPRAASAAR